MLVTQERRADAAFVVFTAVPHRLFAQEKITSSLVASIVAILIVVAAIALWNTSSAITLKLFLRTGGGDLGR